MGAVEREPVVSWDPGVVSGALVFAGTRVPVEILIDHLKTGDTLYRSLEGFPTVSREQAGALLEVALEAVEPRVGRSA